MAKLLKLRRGTTSQHSSFTGAEGEVTVDTDKEALVVHNGSTAGGFPVARADGTGVANFTITGELDAATGDFSGDVDVDGTLEADAITVNGTALGTVIAGTTVTNATNAAGLTGTPNVTVGVVTAGSLDISGNADIDGTLEADAYTVNGTALDTHIAGVTVTNATNAAHVSVADNESTNENNKIVFIEDASATGNVGLESDGDLHYNPSTGLLTVPAVSTSGNITIAGNLTVNGTTTTVATTNTTVTDNLLELNSGASSNANDAGILIERGSTGDNAIIAWDESADKFTVGTTTATNDATGNISITTGTIVANVEGNLTGTASSATNADTVDNLHAASFVRSDTGDNLSGASYNFNGSSSEKIILSGVNDPYIRWQEGTTSKAYIQWSPSGYLQFGNTEDGSVLLLRDDFSFSTDGSTFHKVWHAGNDGAGSGLDADTLDGYSQGNFVRTDGNHTVGGDITFNGGAGAISVNGGSDIRFGNGNWTGNAYGKIEQNGNELFICGGTAGITFREDAVNRWHIDGSGHFVPGSDSSYNIGSTGTRVTNVYADNLHDSKGELRKIPANATTSAYTLVAADSGKVVTNTSGGVNCPYNTFASGDTITIINHSGSDITITQGSSNTMYNTADASTGNRTLAGRGMCTVWYQAHNVCYISGSGLS